MGGAAAQLASAAYIAILVNISTAPIPSDACSSVTDPSKAKEQKSKKSKNIQQKRKKI
jgi:hypothetical protein